METPRQKAFTQWFNLVMNSEGRATVEDLKSSDFADGTAVVRLAETLLHRKLEGSHDAAHSKLNSNIFRLENIGIGLSAFKNDGLRFTEKKEDFVDLKESAIESFLWSVAKKYQMKYKGIGEVTGKKELLRQTNTLLSQFSLTVENFGDSFADGCALCGLVAAKKPGSIDMKAVSPENKAENIDLALSKCSEVGVKPILDKSAFEGEIDDRSMALFVSCFVYGQPGSTGSGAPPAAQNGAPFPAASTASDDWKAKLEAEQASHRSTKESLAQLGAKVVEIETEVGKLRAVASASSSEDTSVTSSEVESLKEQIAEFQKKVASGDNDDELSTKLQTEIDSVRASLAEESIKLQARIADGEVYKKKLAEERTQLAEELRILKEKEGEQAMRQKEIESLKASLQEAKEKVDNDLATLRKEACEKDEEMKSVEAAVEAAKAAVAEAACGADGNSDEEEAMKLREEIASAKREGDEAIEKLQQQRDTATGKIAQSQEQLRILQQEKETLEAELVAKKNKQNSTMQALRKELDEIRSAGPSAQEVEALSNSIEKAENDSKTAENDIKSLSEEVERLKGSHEESDPQEEALRAEVATMKSQQEEKKEEIATKKAALEQAQKKLEEAKQRKSKLEDDLASVKAKKKEGEGEKATRIEALRQELATLQQEEASLSLDEIVQRAKKMEDESIEMAAANEILSDQIEAISGANKDECEEEDETEKLQNQISDLKAKQQRLKAEVSAKQVEVDQAQAKKQELEKTNAELEATLKDAQARAAANEAARSAQSASVRQGEEERVRLDAETKSLESEREELEEKLELELAINEKLSNEEETLKEEYEAVKKRLDEMGGIEVATDNTKVSEEKRAFEKAQADVRDLRAKLQTKIDENDAMETTNQNLVSETKKIFSIVGPTANEILAMQQTLEKLQKEVDIEEETFKDLSEVHEEKKQKLNRVAKAIGGDISNIKQALENETQLRTKAQSTLDALNAQKEALEAKLASCARKTKEISSRTLEDGSAALQSELNELKQQHEATVETRKDTDSQISQLKTDISRVKEQISATEKRASESQGASSQDDAKLKEEIARMKEEIAKEKKTLAEAENSAEKLDAELKSLKRSAESEPSSKKNLKQKTSVNPALEKERNGLRAELNQLKAKTKIAKRRANNAKKLAEAKSAESATMKAKAKSGKLEESGDGSPDKLELEKLKEQIKEQQAALQTLAEEQIKAEQDMNRSIKEKAEAEVHLITLKLKNESRSRCLGQADKSLIEEKCQLERELSEIHEALKKERLALRRVKDSAKGKIADAESMRRTLDKEKETEIKLEKMEQKAEEKREQTLKPIIAQINKAEDDREEVAEEKRNIRRMVKGKPAKTNDSKAEARRKRELEKKPMKSALKDSSASQSLKPRVSFSSENETAATGSSVVSKPAVSKTKAPQWEEAGKSVVAAQPANKKKSQPNKKMIASPASEKSISEKESSVVDTIPVAALKVEEVSFESEEDKSEWDIPTNKKSVSTGKRKRTKKKSERTSNKVGSQANPSDIQRSRKSPKYVGSKVSKPRWARSNRLPAWSGNSVHLILAGIFVCVIVVAILSFLAGNNTKRI